MRNRYNRNRRIYCSGLVTLGISIFVAVAIIYTIVIIRLLKLA